MAHAKALGARVTDVADRMAADFNVTLSYRGQDAAALVAEHLRAEERFTARRERELEVRSCLCPASIASTMH